MSNFRDEAVKLVVDNGLRDLCEVGVWQGDLARMLAPLERTLVLVDPWSALWNNFMLADGRVYDCTMGGPVQSQHALNRMHDDLRDELPDALILRMPSAEAVKHVPPGSLDFVFIDAVHLFEYSWNDLKSWENRLRRPGILAGDDYCGEVKEAVDRFSDSRLLNLEVENNVWRFLL